MSIASRITSIEEHLRESYQELEGIGIDTTEVDKNLENIPKLIDGYWETLPKVTGEGTSITLDSTKEGKMKIGLKGNTSQETTILPSEYTQVDYIESSGTQYIDTGYLSKGDLKVITNIEYTSTVSGNQFIYGGRDSTELNTNALLLSNNGTRFRNDYNTSNTNATPTISNLVTKWHIEKDKGALTITSSDNQTITRTITNATFSSSYNVYVFTCNNANNVLNPASYRLYTFKMYDNDVLVRDYIPCYRNSDNEVGLYDLVNNVFYTNAGTGAFTYGSVATLPNPDYPQDIHVVSGDNSIDVCGKNILYYTNQTTSWSGSKINTNGNTITYTPNDSGQGGMGHTTYTQDIFIPAGSTLTYSQRYVSGSAWTSGSLTNSIILYRKDGTALSKGFGDITPSNYQNIKKITFTTDEDFVGIKCYSMMYAIAGMTTPLVYNVQLEYNSDITDFEPYQSQSYPINLGVENLLPITATTQTINGVVFTVNDDKTITANGTAGTNGINLYTNGYTYTNIPAGTYTLSDGNESQESYNTYFTFIDGGPNSNSTINYPTFTLTTATDLRIRIVIRQGTTLNNVTFKVQLEKGSKKNSYSEYGTTPIELCKIGDYQDSIVKDNGKWYLNKQINKRIFNGTENWVFRVMSGISRFDLSGMGSVGGSAQNNPILCNYFLSKYANEDNVTYLSSTIGAMSIMSNNFSDLATFKNWLSNGNVMVYYALRTPTYTEITDITLQQQLNALEKARSYNSQTNLTQTNDDLPFELTASALLDVNTQIEHLEAQIEALS